VVSIILGYFLISDIRATYCAFAVQWGAVYCDKVETVGYVDEIPLHNGHIIIGAEVG
jgi:hypothetical protein